MIKYALGIDIGGTNTNIGIAKIVDKKIELLFSLNFKTEKLKSIINPINEALEHAKNKYDLNINSACIAVAGIISRDKNYVKLTNSPLKINRNEILKNTTLKNLSIINDFQAIGLGINFLDHHNKEDIIIIREDNKEKRQIHQTKSIIGAGTGLGKSILFYNNRLDKYIPIASEGGHSDFPYQNDFENELVNHIKNKRKILQYLTYEEILSGRGIEAIYEFLKEKKDYKTNEYSREIEKAENKAEVISKYRKKDKLSKDTLELFIKFYARCAKNFALDTFSVGGIYLAGGIVSKNVDFFTKKDFISEFEDAYRRTDLLKNIPIYVIMNYYVSLYGACFAALLEEEHGEII